MLNELINWLIQEIEANISVQAYSPQLPTESGDSVAIRVNGGDTTDSLCGVEEYSEVRFSIISRSDRDDNSLTIIEDVKNLLNNRTQITLTNYTIININGEVPSFVDKDENYQVYYNVDFTANIG